MKLLDQFVVVAQRRRLSEHTIECYLTWIRQFMTFCAGVHGTWKHPAELRTNDVESFLNDLDSQAIVGMTSSLIESTSLAIYILDC